jgi:DNA-binding transcriptional MerR regulator
MKTDPQRLRWLPIGEFAAATQLSVKALRLYAEQRLLTPARVDDATGYRYYGSDQVAKGRLIRTLREMGLSLADIAAVVSVGDAAAHRLLNAFAKGQDQHYARQKRAYRAALVQLQPAVAANAPSVTERSRAAMTVVCREFVCDRESFVERYRSECQDLRRTLAFLQLESAGAASCRLIEPLSDEEGRAEIVIPVTPGASLPAGTTFRQQAGARCALITLDVGLAHASQFAAALDTLFDWFDRRGHATLDCPCVSLDEGLGSLRVEISWSFSPTQNS